MSRKNKGHVIETPQDEKATVAAQFSSTDFDDETAVDDSAPPMADVEPTVGEPSEPPPLDPKAPVPTLGAAQTEPAKPHTIEVWCGQVSQAAYVSSHVETRLYGREGEALKRLAVGLNQRNERLADGTHVNSQPTAIRWLLQQLAEEFLGPLPE